MMSLSYLRHAVLLFSLAALAACGNSNEAVKAPPADPHYAETVDAGVVIPAVSRGYLIGTNPRAEVEYLAGDAPGSIVVDPHARVLYYVQDGGRALRYGIAVGREGKGFRGDATVRRKEAWPHWAPTKNMIRTEPEVYAQYAGGMDGGIDNPLGARALYLYRGGQDTHYRIHGTNNSSTIGRATSAGCIRLYNQDAIDLFEYVSLGTPVHVRSAEESLAIEGELVENAEGFMVPMASLPDDVQAQIRAGMTPWPKFVPIIGVNATAPVLPDPSTTTN